MRACLLRPQTGSIHRAGGAADIAFNAVLPVTQVRVKGQTSNHSIAVQARGGFKWADPDDTATARLLPLMGAAASTGTYTRVPPALQTAMGAGISPAEPFGGGVIPGLRECVVLTYNLEAAATELGERYVWLHAHVALDDSAGEREGGILYVGVRVCATWPRSVWSVMQVRSERPCLQPLLHRHPSRACAVQHREGRDADLGGLGTHGWRGAGLLRVDCGLQVGAGAI